MMSTFTRKLLSIALAMVMILGNVSPAAAAAADYGDIFNLGDDIQTENQGDIFSDDPGDGNTSVSTFSLAPAAAGDGYELIDPAGIKDTAVANSYQTGDTHPEWHDGPASWAFDGNTQTAWHTKYDEGGVDDGMKPYYITWKVG